MTLSWTENRTEQGGLFEGNRPLITHNRKRNAIPAEIPKTTHRSPKQEMKKNPDIPATSCGPTQHLPPTRKRVLVRRNKAAMFKAKVRALLECYRPGDVRKKNENQKRSAASIQKGGAF